MVTASRESLAKPGGEAFACALTDTYYTVCKLMEGEATRDKTLTAMGKRFAGLSLKDMRVIVKETEFYSTPEKGIALFSGEALPKTMQSDVVPWAVEKGLLDADKIPSIAFETGKDVALCFDVQYIKAVMAK